MRTQASRSAPVYSLEARRRLRTQRELPRPPAPEPRTIPWRQWFATVPLEIDQEALRARASEDHPADVYAANCGDIPVWLLRQGPRWLMFAGSRRPESRRRDFASPSLDHAKRTAEAWYGPPQGGWRSEGSSRRPRRSTEGVEAGPDGI